MLISGVFFDSATLAYGAIIGQMPKSNEILYITADPCVTASGVFVPDWYFSYSVDTLGTVTRSCYVRYNDQIWLKGPFGSESVFPMNYFSKPVTSINGKN